LDPETYQIYGIKPFRYIIELACLKKRIDLIDYWISRKYDIDFTGILDLVCSHGKIIVLKYLFYKNLFYDYTEKAIDNASGNGHLRVLQFWLDVIDYKYPLKYTEEAFNGAAANGKLDVIKWWFKTGKQLKYDCRAVDLASANGHLDVLKYIHQHGIFVYTTDAVDMASANGHIHVLEWWRSIENPLLYTKNSIKLAIEKCQYDVLYWWKYSGLELKICQDTMTMIKAHPEINLWYSVTRYSLSDLYHWIQYSSDFINDLIYGILIILNYYYLGQHLESYKD
jgi:hypothetical protein